MKSNYQPRFNRHANVAHVRVFGPVQQGTLTSTGYWAGAYSADELERFGVEAIKFAHDMRKAAVPEPEAEDR